MQLNITARHIDLTPALSDYVHKKVEKAQRYFDEIIWAQAILNVEKRRHIAELVVHTPGKTFRTEAEARRNVLADIGESYLATQGLYQERMHIVTLSGRFVGFLIQAYIDWCDWTLTSLDNWPDDDQGRHEWARTAMQQYLHDIGRSPQG